MPVWLFVLLAAGFVLYTDDYVIAGILPELARDLGVAEAQAGQLITVFSLTVAVAAPVAAVVFARVPRRYLFTAALLVFIAANAAAAFTPSFAVLMALRVVAAGAAASMTPAVFAFAAQHAPAEKVGRYIAVVSLGVTGSIAAGVPVGTWIGGHFGWRATFAAMALAGIAVLVAIAAALPREKDAGEAPGLGEQLRTLRRAPVSLGLLANCALMTGSMMMLTYLAPFLADTTAAGVNERALAFSLSGLAGIACIWLGGSASDRWGPDRALAFGIGTITVSMALLWGLWLLRPAPFSLVIVVGTVWGGMAFWNSPAIQARLHALAGPVAPQALALNTSGTYLGVAAGGAIGGLALSSLGAGALPLIAAGSGLGALLLLTVARRLTVTGAGPVTSGDRG
ncbi:MFS transporter [Nocardiopsis sp. CNT-189]|uniref:MFS transporter n=1 Tax=Nocardiopsis oceanisediminis TaxID=2816862 RepID=UPI003B33CA24